MSLDFTLEETRPVPVLEMNYTHNVVPMWQEAGVYDALYHSEGQLAEDIIPDLSWGVMDMIERSEEYIKLNPDNGWGDYETALEWLKGVLKGCLRHPEAIIRIWR